MKKIIISFPILICVFLCFGIKTNAQYTDLLNFTGTNGAAPFGDVILSGGYLYGMTRNGGLNGDGCIFTIDTNGANYKDLFDFNGTTGANPRGSLIRYGKTLYGMTELGGAHSIGLVFSIDTNGSNYKDLLDFNDTNGATPQGSLILSGKKMFGMTQMGGDRFRYGSIFSVDTNGYNFHNLYYFNGGPEGKYPIGNLILSNSILYGMTGVGGINNAGCIFSLDTNGSGFKYLFSFNGSDGLGAFGTLTLSDSLLYGMTDLGGLTNHGCIFSIDTNGNGYTDIHDFNGTNGAYPYGSLIISGNELYGMTGGGGIDSSGCIFSIETNGSGYIDMHDFSGYPAEGAFPNGSLILSGNTLYGMTQNGGTYDTGVVFSFKQVGLYVNTIRPNSETINIFPNPSTGQFTLSLSNVSEKCNVEVYNVLGERVFTSALPPPNGGGASFSYNLNISSQPDGLYLYRVITENGGLVGEGKVVIQK